MNNKFNVGISLLSFIALLTACGTTTDVSKMYAGETVQQIYMNGKKALEKRNYSEASKRFEALDVQYPYNPYTEKGDLYLIYAYYMRDEYVLAVSAADHYIRLYPTSAHVDYAYYMKGLADFNMNLGVFERHLTIDLANRDLVQIKKTYADFNELMVRFPNSRYRVDAHQHLIYLRNILARHELKVAKYYFGRKAYVAAINRADIVVREFQGAPSVIGALKLIAASYEALGLTKQRDEVLAILAANR